MSNEKNNQEKLPKEKRSLFGKKNKNVNIMQEEQIQSPFRTAVKAFVANKLSMGALILFILIALVMFIGPLLYPVDLGYNEAVQANLPPSNNFMSFPEAMRMNPRSVDQGRAFGVGADQNGDVHVWGQTKLFSMPDLAEIPQEVKDADIVQVGAGFDHMIARDANGKVYGWGNSRQRQIDIPPFLERANVVDVQAGYMFNVAVTDEGESVFFGNMNTADYNEFHEHQFNIKQVALATDVVCAITNDGRVVYLGTQRNSYANVPEGNNFVDIAAGARSFVALDADGGLHAWGNLGYRGEGNFPENMEGKPIKLSSGQYHYSVLTDAGKIYTWGSDALKQREIPSNLQNANITNVFSSYYQNYVVKDNGEMEAFGTKGYLLGSDDFGRDIFNRILNGGRLTLTIGSVAVIISLVIGMILGGVSGYFGGKVDMLIQRLGEIVASMPFLPTIIILNSLIGNKLTNIQRTYLVMVLLGVLSWVGLQRLVRAQVLSIREQEYVLAARAVGIKEFGIVFKHIIPNVISVIIVSATLSFASSLLTEATLSFLGFGVQPPQPTWGNMLFGANNSVVIQNYWWRWVFPSIILSITVICINLIGTGLDDAINPKSRER